MLEKIIARIGDVDVLEELLCREKEGENRDELREIILNLFMDSAVDNYEWVD